MAIINKPPSKKDDAVVEEGEESGQKTSQETRQDSSSAKSEPAKAPEGEEIVDKIAAAVAKRLGIEPPEVQKLPGVAVPVEDVELVGEEINYKVALNPEIFYRYSVFKARAAALGRVEGKLQRLPGHGDEGHAHNAWLVPERAHCRKEWARARTLFPYSEHKFQIM